MKKLLWGLALASFAATSAIAADLPAPSYYAKAPPPPVAYGWTGAYVGANGGYSWGRETDSLAFLGFPFNLNQNINGGFGGGQIGYNWQRGAWVFGVESDFQGSGQRGATTTPLVFPFSFTDSQSLPWFGTDRARVGFLAAPSILLYGTAGITYGRLNSNYSLNVVGVPILNLAINETRAGWTAGAGVEAKFADHWSAKLEYLHLDYGTNTSALSFIGVPIATDNRRLTDEILRVGVNYMFGAW
jgi:outer membrane immunogenic protein